VTNSYRYQYDAVGNKLAVERNKVTSTLGKLLDETGGKTQYKYDELNQLSEIL
jgi:hypothetical protein